MWRVTDRRGEPAAMKVLHARFLATAGVEDSFVHESRALARLDHPCIVPVLDHGRVGEDEARTPVVPGAPWLVLPVLAGGAIDDGAGPPDWPAVRTILRRVLRALAHAHAAGLVHRDVKPGNVLLPSPGAWAECRLADFGLAMPTRPGEEGLSPIAGTPAFMAPEQFQPNGRLVDARADLYAVGGLAWTLVTSGIPYPAEDWYDLRDLHLRGQLGDLRPAMAVPTDLDRWIRALMQVDPSARPGTAAEALAMLDAFGGARLPPAPTDTTAPGPTAIPADVPSFQPDLACPPATPRQPLPAAWKDAERDERPVSLAVLRLRAPPMVGRDAERSRLWRWLRGDGARVLIIEALSGFGRTRLLEWLGARVAEAGAATVWWMVHGERPGPGQGVAGMLARWLRAEGLSGRPLDAWLERLALRRGLVDDVASLAELIDPGGRLHPGDVIERLAPIVTLARRAAPILLLVDDAQWSDDALILAELLLDAGVDARIVLAVDRAKGAPDWHTRLDLLRTRPEVEHLALAPLSSAETRQLAEGSLGLAPTFAARLEARAQGSPRFVVDVLREWWTRGLLVEGPEGFRVRGDERIPGRLHEVWSAALLPLVDNRPRSWRFALEIAAALGIDVDATEWRAACAAAGVEAPQEMIDAGLNLGIFMPHPRGPSVGWRFVHGGFREVVAEHATVRGRNAGWHLACVAALQVRSGAGHAERLAGHLDDAGRPADALPWLRRAAVAEIDGGDRRRSVMLLDRLADAMDRAEVPAIDPQRADLAWHRARARRLLGQAELAATEAAKGLSLARAGGYGAETVRNATELADAWRLLGRFSEAERLLADVEPLAEGDPALLGAVLQRRGSVAFARGEIASMLMFGEAAREAFLAAGDAVSAATALNLVGCGLAQAGRFEEASPLFAAAVDEQDAAGCRWGAADAASNLGYVLIQMGDYDAARPVLEQSIRGWDRAGSPLGNFPRLNLALLHLEQGDVAAAEPFATAALRAARRLHGGAHALAVPLATAWAVASRRGDPEAAGLRGELEAVLTECGGIDPAVARLVELGLRDA